MPYIFDAQIEIPRNFIANATENSGTDYHISFSYRSGVSVGVGMFVESFLMRSVTPTLISYREFHPFGVAPHALPRIRRTNCRAGLRRD